MVGALYGPPVCEGPVAAAVDELAGRGEALNEQVKAYLVETDTPVDGDETGARLKGKLEGRHAASTEQATCEAGHPKRGSQAMEAIDILPERPGRSIHHAWQPSFTYPEAKHGLCHAHLVGELVFLIEHYSQAWANDFLALLLNMKEQGEVAKRLGQSTLSARHVAVVEQVYDWIVDPCERANPPPVRQPNQPGRLKQSPARHLLDCLINYQAEVMAFVHDVAVPFDNTLAERDLRMVTLQPPGSGGLRRVDGAKVFGQVRRYVSTARKNGPPVLDVLYQAVLGTPYGPWFIASTAPEYDIWP